MSALSGSVAGLTRLQGPAVPCLRRDRPGENSPSSRGFGVVSRSVFRFLQAAAVQGNRLLADTFSMHRVNAARYPLSRISHG